MNHDESWLTGGNCQWLVKAKKCNAKSQWMRISIQNPSVWWGECGGILRSSGVNDFFHSIFLWWLCEQWSFSLVCVKNVKTHKKKNIVKILNLCFLLQMGLMALVTPEPRKWLELRYVEQDRRRGTCWNLCRRCSWWWGKAFLGNSIVKFPMHPQRANCGASRF